jgi:hypothetical protein
MATMMLGLGGSKIIGIKNISDYLEAAELNLVGGLILSYKLVTVDGKIIDRNNITDGTWLSLIIPSRSQEEILALQGVIDGLELGRLLARDDCPIELQKDKEVVLVAVKKSGSALRHASKELKGDREIVLEAVKQDGLALQFASEELKNNKEVILVAVKERYVLQFASEELRGDKEIILAATKQNAHALQYASEELKGDKKIVLEAVRQHGYALQYASEELKGDKKIVLEAVKQNRYALQYASEELKGDGDIISEVEKPRRDKPSSSAQQAHVGSRGGLQTGNVQNNRVI